MTNNKGIVTADYVDILFKKYPNLIKNFTFSKSETTKTDMTGRDDYNKIGRGSGSNNGNSGYGPENLDDDSVRGKGGKK